MSRLWISEYPLNPFLRTGTMVGLEPATRVQVVEFNDESVRSEAFSPKTVAVRLHADENCSVKFGEEPTAGPADLRLAADSTEYFAIVAGHRLAVISNE